MPKIENRITIHRSLFDVFRAAMDFERMKEWQPALEALEITSGNPVRPGTMISMRRRFMGRSIFVNVDVIDYQRNKRVEIKGVHGSFLYHRIYEFSSAGGREMQVVDTINIRTSIFFFWYAPFLRSSLKNQVQDEWQTLKQQLETQSGAPMSPPSR